MVTFTRRVYTHQQFFDMITERKRMGFTCSVINCYLPPYRSRHKVNLSCAAFLTNSSYVTFGLLFHVEGFGFPQHSCQVNASEVAFNSHACPDS